MLQDAKEVVTGLVIYTDPVMAPSVQDRKTFGDTKSQSPEFGGRNVPHAPHVAEVLRQAYHSNLKDGDWLGGDAWFGSVAAALALKLEPVVYVNEQTGEESRRKLNVDSTFVIKNNLNLYPKGPLLAVLRARHPKRMAGHWVTFHTVIDGVKLLAVAYAWSNSDITYILSTVGNTTACKDPYVSYDPNMGLMAGIQRSTPDLISLT